MNEVEKLVLQCKILSTAEWVLQKMEHDGAPQETISEMKSARDALVKELAQRMEKVINVDSFWDDVERELTRREEERKNEHN